MQYVSCIAVGCKESCSKFGGGRQLLPSSLRWPATTHCQFKVLSYSHGGVVFSLLGVLCQIPRKPELYLHVHWTILRGKQVYHSRSSQATCKQNCQLTTVL